MSIKLFNTPQLNLLKKAVSVYDKQTNAIAKNVANGTDPKFKRLNTDFSHLLQTATQQSAIKKTNSKHLNSISGNNTGTTQMNTNQNETVNLSKEMTSLADTQLRFEFIARILNRYYRGLSTSIIGRNN